ncbi:hypothetical protein GHT06_011463 [Daphnia sinensis]|uniref:Uncharacterized protein n=1 Tax=Daphnia sinensis TaxID=1820382 RepID=A0AAD5LE32_9CRUS|nr:hypothetical protein GHT06_011463 [Daphnia sinensis]
MEPQPVGDRLLSINDEEITEVFATTPQIAVDEEHRKPVLASLKQAYTSESNQWDKTMKSYDEANSDDHVGMPAFDGDKPKKRDK